MTGAGSFLDAAALLLRAFFDVCRLRLGPQDMPASNGAAAMAVAANMAASAAVNAFAMPAHTAALAALVDMAVTVGLTIAVLQAAGHAARAPQTITALAGSGLVMTALAAPFALGMPAMGIARQTIALVWLAFLGWGLAVTAHVIRHALSVRFAAGLAVALMYFILAFLATSPLMPAAPAAGPA
ncbi:MAG: hypothetical protein AB7Q97_03720 [Gammaproteobacteria bacterium]